MENYDPMSHKNCSFLDKKTEQCNVCNMDIKEGEEVVQIFKGKVTSILMNGDIEDPDIQLAVVGDDENYTLVHAACRGEL